MIQRGRSGQLCLAPGLALALTTDQFPRTIILRVKQVTGSPNLWVKPDMFCEVSIAATKVSPDPDRLRKLTAGREQVFGHFGPSLLITEGDEYKRHRKAAGEWPLSAPAG